GSKPKSFPRRDTTRTGTSSLSPILDLADFLGNDPHLVAAGQTLRKAPSPRFRFFLRGEPQLRLVARQQCGSAFVDHRLPALFHRYGIASPQGGDDLER